MIVHNDDCIVVVVVVYCKYWNSYIPFLQNATFLRLGKKGEFFFSGIQMKLSESLSTQAH